MGKEWGNNGGPMPAMYHELICTIGAQADIQWGEAIYWQMYRRYILGQKWYGWPRQGCCCWSICLVASIASERIYYSSVYFFLKRENQLTARFHAARVIKSSPCLQLSPKTGRFRRLWSLVLLQVIPPTTTKPAGMPRRAEVGSQY